MEDCVDDQWRHRKWRHRNRKWCHRNRKSWTGHEKEIISRAVSPYFPRFFSGTPLDSRYEQWNLNPTNRRPSYIWIPPIVTLVASNSKPTNRMLSIWIQPMVSLLWTANRQPSVVRSSIWKSHFTSWFQAVRTSFAFKIVYIISKFVYCASDSQTSILLQGKTNLLFL